jgi:hypothetical protein
MIGKFGDRVTHVPTGTLGKVIMHPSGSIGIFSTAVELENGQVEEYPDSELRVSEGNGAFVVHGLRFSSNRPIPDKMEVRLQNNGDGTVTVTGQVPGVPPVTLYNLPIQNGEVVLPDDVFFPTHR